jgi:AcrR family transcriptional regulator
LGRARRPYHHGQLRDALLEAGTVILDRDGFERLSLRACAAEAGVSHAAPNHHFGNLAGLSTALARLAFERFVAVIAAAQAAEGSDAAARLRAAGRGYVTFAKRHPGLFRLMFDRHRLDWQDAALGAAADAAYTQLLETVAPFAPAQERATLDRLALTVWSTVHGYAHLLLAGPIDRHGISADGLSHLPDLVAVVRAAAEGREGAAFP